MVNSRDLDDLIPPAKSRFLSLIYSCKVDPWLKANGITLLIISTFRDDEAQANLYAQGRTKPGRIVTKAKPGESWHNWRCAGDVLLLRNGKPIWGTKGNGIDSDPLDDSTDDLEAWQSVGKLGERAGLEWAGRWTGFPELGHFQYTGGLTLSDLRAGKVPS